MLWCMGWGWRMLIDGGRAATVTVAVTVPATVTVVVTVPATVAAPVATVTVPAATTQ